MYRISVCVFTYLDIVSLLLICSEEAKIQRSAMSGFEKPSGDCISHKCGERNQFMPFLSTSHIVLQFVSFILLPFLYKNFVSSFMKTIQLMFRIFFFKCTLISDKI